MMIKDGMVIRMKVFNIMGFRWKIEFVGAGKVTIYLCVIDRHAVFVMSSISFIFWKNWSEWVFAIKHALKVFNGIEKSQFLYGQKLLI